ncbi:MAG: FAD-binding oxidoreductase, partial [Candidatus Thermoplasmatota archaeon]
MNKIFAIKLKSDISGGGEIRIIADKEKISSSYLDYLHDESRLSYGEIECIAFPETEAQVAEFLQFANLRRMPVTISNGRTGIVGGAVPLKGALLSLEKLNKILEVKCIDSNYTVAMQAGVSLNELAKFLDGKNFPDGKYFYPVDVTEMTARIGGTVATNASGERSFRYGPTRNWVKRIRVVLATGEVLEINRGEIFADERNEFEIEFPDGRITKIKIPSYKMPSVKSVAGYYTKPKMDLIDLFIGSEGTLGVITEIEIKIIKK